MSGASSLQRQEHHQVATQSKLSTVLQARSSPASPSSPTSCAQPLNVANKVNHFEHFINDVLKDKLRVYERELNSLTCEVSEYVQLKNIIETLDEQKQKVEENDPNESGATFDGTIKTQVDIGCNYYLQAKSNEKIVSHILVDVGLNVFVELSLKQALVFVNKKIDFYNCQIKEIKSNIAITKAHIKLTLFGIQELLNVK